MPPVNDDFASAATLTGAFGSTTGSNVGATLEGAEPAFVEGDGTNNATVWWKWTAPSSGNFIFSLGGSTFDTCLEVYTGAALGSLTFVASDDDSGPGPTSRLTITAVSGTTYRFRVFGYTAGEEGAIALAWHKDIPPPNITSRTPSEGLIGSSVVLTGTDFSAVTSVTIGGVDAPFTIDSSTQITATVPNGAAGVNSPIDVANDAGSDELIGFTPLYPGPWTQPDDLWQGAWSVAGANGLINFGEHLVIPDLPADPYVVVDVDERTDGSGSIDFSADLAFLPHVAPGSFPPDALSVEYETVYGTALGPVKVDITSIDVAASSLIGPHRVSGTWDADPTLEDSNIEITIDGAGISYDHQFDAGTATLDGGTHFNNAFTSYADVELLGDISGGTTIDVTGTPTVVSGGVLNPADPDAPHELQWHLDGGGSTNVSVWARPPRYRFLYPTPPGRPPLAHRQRRDGAATVGPPLAHRQGGTGAQRPDLAHRQQTP